MALPQMHGRTHVPAGYAVSVQAVSDPTTLLDQASSDQIPCKLSTSGITPSYGWLQWGNGTAAPTNQTWQTMKAAAGGSPDYFSGFESDPNDFGISVDLVNGVITWDNGGGSFQQPLAHVTATAWVDTTVGWVTGDVAGVGFQIGIDGGSFGNRFVNAVTIGASALVTNNNRITCSGMIHSGYNRNSARLQVYADSAATNTRFADIDLTVVILRSGDGTALP